PTYIDLTVDTFSAGVYGAYAMCPHDWSPDGTSLVYGRGDTNQGLWRADASDGFASPDRLTSSKAGDPRWAPDGSKIVFLVAGTGAGIVTIEPDGANQTVVIAKPANKKTRSFRLIRPHWSPNGTHLIYGYTVENFHHGRLSFTGDVYRAVADGTYQTNLTAASDDFCWPIGWRD
ncbi:MAG: TolB family protein, partial [Planctomycetota bacterium]